MANLVWSYWVHLGQPYGFQGRKALYLQASHFIVTYQDPRCLLIRVNAPRFQAWICVAHAPHCGAVEEERLHWWLSLQRRLQHYCALESLFLLLDANATSGPRDAIHVFDNDSAENANTDSFRDLLRECGLCLPGTSNIHQGETATWVNPSGSHSQRIDYVAVPLDFAGAVTYSTDLHTLDFDSADHVGTALQLEWEAALCPPSSSTGTRPRTGYDRPSIDRSDALRKSLITDIGVHWRTDIELRATSLPSMAKSLRPWTPIALRHKWQPKSHT